MKFMLIIYSIISGEVSTNHLAIFASEDACQSSGKVLSDYAERYNSHGAPVWFECKPF